MKKNSTVQFKSKPKMNKANTFPNSERNPKRNPKNSPLPNLDGETNSIPSFLNLFPDPRHHDDATLDKRPILYHSETTETSPFKFILSPSVSTSSMANFPPLEENQAVKRLKQFSGNVPARLDVPTLTDTSSAGSNQFSGEVGAQSEYESPCVFNEQGFTFTEVSAVRASRRKVVCCQFSSDGKLLASGGHDRKTVLWSTDTLKAKSTLEGHSSLITDVRFSPSMPRLATSSWDKTVRVWDADNPGYSLRALTGHSASISSLDFHPNKDDLICSSDVGGEIMYWSINSGSCQRFFKCVTSHVRFQPRLGRYLAAAAENFVAIVDVETQTLRHSLRGHQKQIGYICWDPSGELLASVSEDSVRVWTFGSGSEGDCIHELSCDGYESHSCVFHPYYASLLVLGCYRSLQLWNMNENKIMTLPAHDGLIAGLAVSPVTGLVASASHDNFVKLWK